MHGLELVFTATAKTLYDDTQRKLQELEAALVKWVRLYDAANARVAELEREAADWKAERRIFCDSSHRMSIQLTAANARAATAERGARDLQRRLDAMCNELAAEIKRGQAAKARADAAEQEARIACDGHTFWMQAAKNLGEARTEAESEAAALRAELEHAKGRENELRATSIANSARAFAAESLLAAVREMLSR